MRVCNGNSRSTLVKVVICVENRLKYLIKCWLDSSIWSTHSDGNPVELAYQYSQQYLAYAIHFNDSLPFVYLIFQRDDGSIDVTLVTSLHAVLRSSLSGLIQKKLSDESKKEYISITDQHRAEMIQAGGDVPHCGVEFKTCHHFYEPAFHTASNNLDNYSLTYYEIQKRGVLFTIMTGRSCM